MKNSKELFKRRQELADKQAELMAEDNADDARIIEGQIRELDITLEHVLEEEERLRDQFQAVPTAELSFGEQILGSRDEFTGLEFGFKAEADEGSGPVVHVAGPQEIELTLPAKPERLLYNFAETLISVTAKGSVSFKQRSTQTGTPATWAGVDPYTGESATKAKVLYTWKDAVANKEAIAGYVPVSKDTLRDYDELMSILDHDLLLDLDEAEDDKMLTGNNASGIIGVLNASGILTYETHEGGKYWEAVRKMRTKVMKDARTVPTHVCMHPDIKEAIDLYKDSQNRYQQLQIQEGIMWGMQVIEDFNCNGILVYDAYAAKKRPVHGTTVEVGYYNDQFIKNELSILAERTTCLQIVRPDAFCYATKANLDA